MPHQLVTLALLCNEGFVHSVVCAQLLMVLTVAGWAAQLLVPSKADEQQHKRVKIAFLPTEHFACLAVCGSRHAVPKTRVHEMEQQGVPEAAPVPAARRVAATSARPLLRSLPSTAMSCLTRKYFPLPHPTSATKDPGASLSMNCLTCNATGCKLIKWGTAA